VGVGSEESYVNVLGIGQKPDDSLHGGKISRNVRRFLSGFVVNFPFNRLFFPLFVEELIFFSLGTGKTVV